MHAPTVSYESQSLCSILMHPHVSIPWYNTPSVPIRSPKKTGLRSLTDKNLARSKVQCHLHSNINDLHKHVAANGPADSDWGAK